ncbi:LysM peptidoglycan-binding domain-containing protein [Aspergillus tubingensis]|uniref:LysM peptidoglycan-binding domain-containing protein n=1 Tax=Aspergillus tubingensis TaxID=5068 RepID=UPI001577D959|nr:carbohydrate-binding module family 50 protein [Aspergillus tubingensis]GFN17061.1 carbohydrate-binding module family 50 protein [Aspergillus tubingensis]
MKTPSACGRKRCNHDHNRWSNTLAYPDAGVALSELYVWNPATGSDCSGLQVIVFVCVGTSGYATTITSGDPVPVTPTPTQTGMVSGCLRIYDVQSIDDCYDLAREAGVQLSDFYSWNPALGTDCAGLEASTYVCIGTTGPITTINSGTPVSATGTATATA